MEATNSIAAPIWTNPPFAAIGSRIFNKTFATNTSAMSIEVIIKLNVRLRELE
jgi:hypothetical protein